MPAVHPFARKCESVIAHLREILDGLRRAKKKTDEIKAKKPKDRDTGTLDQLGVIWLLGSPQMENQAAAFGSERGVNTHYDKAQPKAPKMKKGSDKQLNRLLYNYEMARFRCAQKNARDNQGYYRCVAQVSKSGGDPNAACRSMYRPYECPDAVAAREALDAYEKAKGSRTGDGAGGGW